MIGFDYLGKAGQLGNQMFQYAATKGIAVHRGYEMCIPDHDEVFHDGIGNYLRIELDKPFTIPSRRGIVGGSVVQEQGFHFNENLFENCPDNVSLYGFFQSEKYFKHIEDEIRQDFKFNSNIQGECEPIVDEVFDQSPIALHIRRGDFLTNNANHNNLTLDYYFAALGKFEDDRNVIIFSDDTEWCKQQELFSGDRFLVSESGNPYVDMCLMSMCSDFIIANSTFSWWGAWLANSKQVIAPTKWFGPGNKTKDTSDLIPERWTHI